MHDPHDWRADVRARLASSGLHPQDEAELADEVGQHLEAQFAELAPKIGPVAAREQLLAELREQGFDEAASRRRRRARPSRARVWSSTSVLRDLRYGFRSLRRSPGTVAAGVAALALGIGLTTMMYSIIYGLLLKGLPFDDPSRIALIYRADPTGRGEEDLVPYGDYVRYRAEQRSFAVYGAYYTAMASISGGDRPERIDVARVTSGALDVTGARAALGRTFTSADNAPDAPPTVLLGYAIWRDRFARDSSVVGKPLRVNGRAYTIIGVMPDGFEFPRSQKMWLPVQLDAAGLAPGQGRPVNIVGRLRPGVELGNANAELAGLSRRLARENGDTAAVRDLAQPFVRALIPARVYSLLYAMLGAVFLVLLVACANVANLLLDRAANRSREIGIRVALGASRVAVIRQSLVESGILAGMAAIAGVALAQSGIVAFNRTMLAIQADTPFWADIRLHLPVLLFVIGVAVAASIVSGLLPALHSARVDVNTILKDESHSASSRRVGRLSRAIVVAEIALSSAMLLAAGFMTKSIVRMRMMDPHFTTNAIFTARITASSSTDTARARQLFEGLERDLASVSGVDGAVLANGLPGVEWQGGRVEVEGHVYARPQERPVTRTLAVSSGFFRTFGVSLLQGRGILSTDRAQTQRVVVINDAFARWQFAGVNPIGRRIRLGETPTDADWATVVGVIPTLYAGNSRNAWPPEVLTSLAQEPRLSSVSIALRGADGVANAATVRRIVSALDPEVPVYSIASMDELMFRAQWPVRVLGTMFVLFGVASLVLAAIGLYAVMAFSVSRRTREMGIRIALGATAGSVVGMICRQGAVQIALGMTVGFAVGALVVQAARAALFEVRPSDPWVFGASALAACLIPAFRATGVDPVIALRSE